MNFIDTGSGFCMRRRRLFPEGRRSISIPLDLRLCIRQALREMPRAPRLYHPDGPEYGKRLRIRLGLEPL